MSLLSSFVSGGLGIFVGWILCRRFGRPLAGLRHMSKTASASTLRNSFKVVSNEKMKLVLVVRTDLNMGKGKIAAQCSHATLSCFEDAQQSHPELLEAWEDQGQPKIVLKANSYEELELLSAQAESLGLVNCIIHDAGHTQVEPGTATVLGIGPGVASVIDQVSGHLKLM
ncbi:unnamed protein product [Calicophoron daubneyi]|uniref:peptidyl-tRNA hydrolase n=1 Tax=Calicophoron daubneyi TaxID=300641 RepID=A0AAV2T888_CALDB